MTKNSPPQPSATNGYRSRLRDNHPCDWVHRINHLLSSDVPEEREAGAREMNVLIHTSRETRDLLSDALYSAAELAFPNAPPLRELLDSEWCVRGGARGQITATRHLCGHVLVVRESGSSPGWFYPVVDGHHLSEKGGPWAYITISKAMAAAEHAVGPQQSIEEILGWVNDE
jgi:hypothetical protein